MGVLDNNLDGLERQRLELESNILQLQKSLYYWRTWEAEYDALKEEIGELNDDATVDDFLQVSRDFGGTLVNEDEFRVIIGEKQGLQRTRQQVTDLISRRIDYVRNNVASIEKRLRAAENQQNALDSTDQLPGEPTADFPMKEIIEELDEDGEVISSSTTNPGDQASDLLKILKEAGVEDIPDVPKSNGSTAVPEPSLSKSTSDDVYVAKEKQEHKKADRPVAKVESISLDSNGVSKALGDGPDAVPPTAAKKEIPIVDVDESQEDANLRREMIHYGLDEVGAVVAELELDEEGSDVSLDEYTYDDDGSDDGDEEEEDEHGRSTRSLLDEDYHQQMRELEAKLNARGMWNVGKDGQSLTKSMKEDLQQAGKVKIERTDPTTEPVAKAKPKKKVAFADDVDIAPAPKPPVSESKKTITKEVNVPVLSDSIVERTEPIKKDSATSDALAPKKTSRFRSARGLVGNNMEVSTTPPSGNSQSIKPTQRKTTVPPPSSLPLFPARPSDPKPFSQPISDNIEKSPTPAKSGKILADTLVERDTTEGGAKAPEPDELDEELHMKEIASEFYRMTNKMAKQNANSHDEESEMVPVESEEPPQRISKFRAARMG
ncbi:Prefoldin subunit-domain-containing protein [Aspergillus cavernicola]|uniref:Prefoldin subunit-domain-containing protein n=1 Tax=Aspergillus cavernicola TaxID=176166 RepID=A0ABR4HUJ4_9EURO